MIIFRCRLVLAQVVVGRGPQKVANRKLGQKLGAGVQRFDHQFIVLVFIGGGGQIAVRGAHAGFELERGQQFLLGLGKLALLQKQPAQAVAQVGIVGLGCQQRAILGFGQIVFLRIGV